MSYARQSVTRLTLDMALPDVQKSVSCTLGDVNRRLEVTLIDHGVPFALPSDWTVFLVGVKPDDMRLANSCLVDRGRIVYDFAGGPEIATCAGVFAVVFEVYDEVGEIVATPKVWVHVADNMGSKIVNSSDQFNVLSDLIGRINRAQEDADGLKTNVENLLSKMVSGGIVTIPVGEWTDNLPTMANVSVNGVESGDLVLLAPADDLTRRIAVNVGLYAYPAAFTPDGGASNVSIFRAEAETAPVSDMRFAYAVLKTGIPGSPPIAAIIGVDAYGKGGGGNGGGSVDPEIVNQVLVAASAAHDSANQAQGYADSAQTAKTEAENAASRSEEAAELAAEIAESIAGSGGGRGEIYVGGGDMPDGCVLQIILDDEDEPVVPDEPVIPTTYTVTYRLTNCLSREGYVNGSVVSVVKGSEYQDTITAAEGFTLDTLTVTMGGNPVTVADGIFSISNVTGNIVITARATAVETPDETTKYTVTVDKTHSGVMFVQSRPTEIEEGGNLYLQVVAQSGGDFSINITMGGVDITDTAYKDLSGGSSASSDYGAIDIKHVTGDIVITIRPV